MSVPRGRRAAFPAAVAGFVAVRAPSAFYLALGPKLTATLGCWSQPMIGEVF